MSCTPFFSKLLETFLLDDIKRTTTLSANQYGGKKGQGVDHYLIEMFDYIDRSLEDKGAAVGVMAIDFHKAFNRLSHSACLDSLRELGARPHTIKLVNAFLHGRSMQVKIRDTLSNCLQVPGGAPQGSILGSQLFCSTIDKLLRPPPNLDDSLDDDNSGEQREHEVSMNENWTENSAPELDLTGGSEEESPYFFRWRRNPLDDTEHSFRATQDEIDEELGVPEGWRPSKPQINGYIDDISVVEKLRHTNAITHYTEQKPRKLIHAPESEKIFTHVGEESGKLGMQINPSKTQMLCISSSNEATMESHVRAADARIESGRRKNRERPTQESRAAKN